MKELLIKEKAQRYDEAFRIAQELYDNPNSSNIGKGYVCTIFPELKDSEDERIRNEIILYIGAKDDISLDTHNKWLYWLEKQGEQKHANKFEQKSTDKTKPRFKIGDWVVRDNTIAQILNIQEQYYVGLDINGKDFTSSRFLNNDKIHLWTIADAKDGDVLNSVRVKATIIFKEWNSDGKHINAYCALQKGILIKQEMLWDRDFEPATNEQSDTLMKAMDDAGYTFDFEKKELKNIEQKSAEWSEEDEKTWKELIEEVKDQIDSVPAPDCRYKEDEKVLKPLIELLTWLKSLRERV